MKKVRVNQRLSFFFQTAFSLCPKCYTSSPRAIGTLVPEKKIFKGFLQYIREGGQLGNVTKIRRTNFRPQYPFKLHVNLVYIGPVVSEEKTFEEFSLNAFVKQVTPVAGPFLTTGL